MTMRRQAKIYGTINEDIDFIVATCMCGNEFKYGTFVISSYNQDTESAAQCPRCGRKFYMETTVKVYEVKEL
jgi:hypothetical protein